MKTKILFYLMVFAGIIGITSCSKYPPDVERVQEDLAVISNWDVKQDFSSYDTYWMSDSIYYKDGNDSGWVDNARTGSITAEIRKMMTKYGYTSFSGSGRPDLVINVTLIKNTNVNVYYPYYPYWGYWGYPYNPYYWYGYYPYVTTYSVGTVIIDMADVKNSTGNKVYIIWDAVIRGLYTGTHTTQQIQQSVDVAFDQSTCFQKP